MADNDIRAEDLDINAELSAATERRQHAIEAAAAAFAREQAEREAAQAAREAKLEDNRKFLTELVAKINEAGDWHVAAFRPSVEVASLNGVIPSLTEIEDFAGEKQAVELPLLFDSGQLATAGPLPGPNPDGTLTFYAFDRDDPRGFVSYMVSSREESFECWRVNWRHRRGGGWVMSHGGILADSGAETLGRLELARWIADRIVSEKDTPEWKLPDETLSVRGNFLGLPVEGPPRPLSEVVYDLLMAQDRDVVRVEGPAGSGKDTSVEMALDKAGLQAHESSLPDDARIYRTPDGFPDIHIVDDRGALQVRTGVRRDGLLVLSQPVTVDKYADLLAYHGDARAGDREI